MSELAPDSPITFAEAARDILRGLVTASTVRAAADRGELDYEKIGRRVVTTPAAVEEWRRRCRVKARGRDSTSANGPDASLNGLSETEREKLAVTHARMSAERLKRRSLNT